MRGNGRHMTTVHVCEALKFVRRVRFDFVPQPISPKRPLW
jgi:hypothetical protein